jgi:hypothetical protein
MEPNRLTGTGRKFAFARSRSCRSNRFTAERQVTNSLQTGTTQRWNGSTGRGAVIAESELERLELAGSCTGFLDIDTVARPRVVSGKTAEPNALGETRAGSLDRQDQDSPLSVK